jgi:hypothetical protein
VLILQPPSDPGSPLADLSTLKMEVIWSSEKSVNAGSTQLHTPEDDILYSNRVRCCHFYIGNDDEHIFGLVYLILIGSRGFA